MNTPRSLLQLAIGSMVVAGAVTVTTGAHAADASMEQCAGVVKAGKNDCATSTNACHGHVTTDANPEAWIYVPKGTCAKIAGARVVKVVDPTPKPEDLMPTCRARGRMGRGHGNGDHDATPATRIHPATASSAATRVVAAACEHAGDRHRSRDLVAAHAADRAVDVDRALEPRQAPALTEHRGVDPMSDSTHDWALVLAAGEGSRLRSLTTANGVAVPKQFCSLDGGPSLLQEALLRAEAIALRPRLCAVVAPQHRQYWQQPLGLLPDANVIEQPRNRGTALGILLPLLRLERRDPQARLLLLPSDHHVRDEDALARCLRAAMGLTATHDEKIVLLGIEPDSADPELGYVLPGRESGQGLREIERFVEKPSAAIARALIERGAAWNSFIVAGSLGALLGLYQRRFASIVESMRGAIATDALRGGSEALTALYARLPEIDFSRHVLEGQEQCLRVLAAPACGWSDLGTPQRVADALRRLKAARRPRRPLVAAGAILSLARQHALLQPTG